MARRCRARGAACGPWRKSASNTSRCWWPETRKPEYLKINPNGHVPTLDDNGTIIWESMAINLYVAEKYGKAPLWPSTVEGHGACYQWSLWAMLEVEGPMFDVFKNRILLPADERDENVALAGLEKIKAPLKVLDDHLQKSEYLLGKEFTIADLNVASVMILARIFNWICRRLRRRRSGCKNVWRVRPTRKWRR